MGRGNSSAGGCQPSANPAILAPDKAGFESGSSSRAGSPNHVVAGMAKAERHSARRTRCRRRHCQPVRRFSVAAPGIECPRSRRKGPAAEASGGNAGAFAFSEIVPLATPGTVRKAPSWLFDPLGPLSIPPAYAFRLAPWMLRFWRASRRRRVEKSIRAQAALMGYCKHALLPFLKQMATSDMLRRDGNLEVYESRAGVRGRSYLLGDAPAIRNSLRTYSWRIRPWRHPAGSRQTFRFGDIYAGMIFDIGSAGIRADRGGHLSQPRWHPRNCRSSVAVVR